MSNSFIAETSRIILREFTKKDAEALYLLNSDPDVIRYTGDEAFKSIQAAIDFIQNYDHYKKNGFGRWAAIDKINGEFLGWCGLKYSEATSEYDVGYRFFKKNWGKGFATEAAEACLKLGFEHFNMPVIIGRVMPENTASIKVLEKTGLHFYKEGTCKGGSAKIYRIDKEEYLKNKTAC